MLNKLNSFRNVIDLNGKLGKILSGCIQSSMHGFDEGVFLLFSLSIKDCFYLWH